jgi:FKBP-type peptidyl-prolyl cis-trans isomerase 2
MQAKLRVKSRLKKPAKTIYHARFIFSILTMRKIVLLSLWLMIPALLVGCGKTTTPPSDSQAAQETTVLPPYSWTMCASAIKDYLAKADTKGKAGKKVKKWQEVTVHYIGRLDDEVVFDTSIEEIAKACGKYNAQRNYNEGLVFEVGTGQMIAGFDKAVEGMQIGQTKTVHIEAIDAYGERSDQNLIKIPREQIPDADKLEKWMKVYASTGQPFTVYAVDKKEITLDANPELAGKKLIFDITVTAIN